MQRSARSECIQYASEPLRMSVHVKSMSGKRIVRDKIRKVRCWELSCLVLGSEASLMDNKGPTARAE